MVLHEFEWNRFMKIYGCEVGLKKLDVKNVPFLKFRQSLEIGIGKLFPQGPEKSIFFVKINVSGFIKKFYGMLCRSLIFEIMKWS